MNFRNWSYFYFRFFLSAPYLILGKERKDLIKPRPLSITVPMTTKSRLVKVTRWHLSFRSYIKLSNIFSFHIFLSITIMTRRINQINWERYPTSFDFPHMPFFDNGLHKGLNQLCRHQQHSFRQEKERSLYDQHLRFY